MVVDLTSECQVVVLEVQSNSWEVYNWLDTSLLQLRGITDTAALEDQWR